ncbi:MAG: iron uptake system protein EfeO [Rhodoglobus sp.]
MPETVHKHRRLLTAAAVAGVLALALAGCVPNNAQGATALTVAVTDDSCVVSAATAAAGPITFAVTNTGTDVNEFEILAEDKLRIVGEKENVTPDQTVSFVVQLEPGTYYTACKFQQVGAPMGIAEFTVTGAASAISADQQALSDQAVANYISYVKSQVAELIPNVKALTDAYAAGDDDTARSLFATARVSYERIEPTAEAFGDLDPKIDYREVDAAAEGLDWTGFHRIEKDLWPPAADALNSDGTSALLDWQPSTPSERAGYAQGLVDDVQSLADLVNAKDFSVSLADISNGAIGLLDEVAASKITGEEDWWSHTDLYDFLANVQGAEVAFGNVRDIAESKGTEGKALVTEIDAEFTKLTALLGTYGTIETGFVGYDTVTDAQRKELSDQVNALAEPLSKLTHTVLGVAE